MCRVVLRFDDSVMEFREPDRDRLTNGTLDGHGSKAVQEKALFTRHE
jgi:hypothetical protein